MSSTMILHKGAREISLEELRLVRTPPPTDTHFPIPFDKTLDITLLNLRDAGFKPTRQKLAILREERFFATIDTESTLVPGVTLAVAIRSSHDASLAYGFTAGNRTMICDNLAMTSDLSLHVKRKHTRNGEESFSTSMCRVIKEKLPQFQTQEAERIRMMMHTEISDAFAESALLRLYQDESILSPRNINVALKEWREPSFEDFDQKNIWRLYNAVTYAIAPRFKSNPQAAAQATIRLGGLLSVQDVSHLTEVHEATAA